MQETPDIDSRHPHILIVRAGALGDTLSTLPAIAAFRQRHPGVLMTVAGYPSIWEVAGGLVDERLSIDAPMCAGLLGGVPTTESLALVRGHDLTVVWSTQAPHPAFEEHGAHLIHASPYPPPGMHAATWLAHTLDLPDHPPELDVLQLTSGEREAGFKTLQQHGLGRPIVIHPGAGAPWKRWPATRFAEVARALTARGHEVALLAGPADDKAISAVTRGPHHSLPMLRDLPLRTVAAVLAQCAAYLGNDSGISHLAAMAGAHTVAIFGPTDPENWAPLGDVCILRACAHRTTAQGQIRVCDDPACLEAVPVEQVLEALR